MGEHQSGVCSSLLGRQMRTRCCSMSQPGLTSSCRLPTMLQLPHWLPQQWAAALLVCPASSSSARHKDTATISAVVYVFAIGSYNPGQTHVEHMVTQKRRCRHNPPLHHACIYAYCRSCACSSCLVLLACSCCHKSLWPLGQQHAELCVASRGQHWRQCKHCNSWQALKGHDVHVYK